MFIYLFLYKEDIRPSSLTRICRTCYFTGELMSEPTMLDANKEMKLILDLEV